MRLMWLADAAGEIRKGADAACGNACGPANINVIFSNIANMLIFIVGAVSVIMIIVGGLWLVTSNGDSKRVEQGRNTILYAVIGLIVAIASFAIVNFVVGKF